MSFAGTDLNGDGVIAGAERPTATHGVQARDRTMPPLESGLDVWSALNDANSDGRVTWTEFRDRLPPVLIRGNDER